MTKRSVRADIDDLNEDVLGDLTPDQRTELYHEAVAAGREEWVETLRKTCDWRRYRAMEMAYTDRIEASFQLLQATLYELHTTVLHYQLCRERQHRQWATDWEREEEEEEEPPAARVEAAVERADQIRCFFIKLYAHYHAAQRFATEVLGVDLRTWLAPRPEGEAVLELVEQVIAQDHEKERAEKFLADRAESDEDTPTLETHVEAAYDELVGLWETGLQNTPD